MACCLRHSVLYYWFVDWFQVAQVSDKWLALVNTVMDVGLRKRQVIC